MAPLEENKMAGKHRILTIISAALVVLAGLSSCAAIGRAPRSGSLPGEIIAAMPAENPAEESRLSARLIDEGPTVIMEICWMLVPPGTGDDTGARYALSGLSRHVGRPGAETERRIYSEVLIEALENASDREVKAFLIRQLQLVGKEEAVTPLGEYLNNQNLCEPAAQALLAIGTPAVEGEFLKALPSAGEQSSITIIKALGDLRCRAAAFEVWKYTASGNSDLRDAALYALANIGPVSSEMLLGKETESASSYERAAATSYLLLYAKRMAEAGMKEESAAICREIMRKRAAEGEENIQTAALATLVEILEEESLVDVYVASRSPNIQIRRAALTIALDFPGENATLMWLNLQMRAEPGLQSEIRSMLRQRSDHYPVPALREAIEEWDKEELARQKAIAWTSLDSLAMVEEGFSSLFNGNDLTGWIGDTFGYLVEDGSIVVDPERRGGGGNLYTVQEYDNFILRFQFRLTPGANNGLGIRAPLEGDAAYAGMELQILDNSAETYANLQPYQYHGSIYGVVPARRGYQKPVGEWNTQEVIADGRQITVILNGRVIVNADIDEASTPETMDHRDHPGLKREKGHIGFLGHGSRVEFRNIWIKEKSEF